MAKVGSAFENNCILTAVGVIAIIINSSIITKFGRRRVFLFWGMILCGICQLLIAIIYTVQPGTVSTGKAIVGLSILYIVGYNGMIATYAWLSGGEFPSQRLRSYTFGFAAAIGFLGAWLASFTAPYFINPAALGWGPKYGYIWCPSCFLGAAWVWFYLPEVKNRTFEEIDEMVCSVASSKVKTVKTNSKSSSWRNSLPGNLEGMNVLVLRRWQSMRRSQELVFRRLCGLIQRLLLRRLYMWNE
jgi:SP family sugar:H+ symporter-like MFS transporter